MIKMGFFGSIKNAFSSEMADFWTVLEDPSRVHTLVQASDKRPQLIYKHSNRCATCLFAKKQVEEVADPIVEKADLYFVDVIGSRSVSNAIANELDVHHESPQIILVHKGEVVWHDSHGQIKGEAIQSALQKVT